MLMLAGPQGTGSAAAGFNPADFKTLLMESAFAMPSILSRMYVLFT